ncbi:MAG TPA: single-stranded-DNA-specific exonuclease RecJ [Myxococcales bacterium]|nr:single-stranded-DNA-specific exonuclease RecJ [Myxococcales bacterium]HIN85138.1 single-stranded-DNA-specific exonuclease RecJ [Myxococcales bacterium]
MVERIWQLSEPDSSIVSELTQSLQLPNIVAELLANRGIDSVEQAQVFLDPRLHNLDDPSSMADMAVAVDLILSTLEQGKRVTIYGDYDVDGMTSASVLTRFLRLCGFDPHCFLPDRFNDGYGLNPDRLRELIAEGTQLFISVDCGVSAVKEIALARELGADFVVVDHHQLPQGALPTANAILNPHRPDCKFPFKDLCAAGLSFYLALALRAELRSRGHFADLPEPDLREVLDIVAIGTIADVVPLHGLNRVIVNAGLPRVAHSKHPGIRALTALAASNRPITASTVAFQIGPRLNAAGRLSHPFRGFELLTTNDPETAQTIANEIEDANIKRRDIQKQIEEEALAMASESEEIQPAYVLWHPEWHVGVTGVVAARIVERFHRPCAMVAIVNGMGKGSIRSITGFDAVEGLRRCSHLLEQFGGHPYAAGLSILPENLPEFRKVFAAAALDLTPTDRLNPRLRVDAQINLGELDSRLIDDLSRLEPFGAGNPEPCLSATNVTVANARRVGQDGAHLKLGLEQSGRKFDAIAFGRGEQMPSKGSLIDIAFRPEYNHFRGRVSVQLRIKDFKPSPA